MPLAERRLNSLRQIAAGLPAKEAVLKQAETELAAREKTIIVSGHQRPGAGQVARSREAHRPGQWNRDPRRRYSLLPKRSATLWRSLRRCNFTCRIDQFVNFFADLSREPDMLAPSEIPAMSSQDQKNKTINVRMILSGVVPRKLVPKGILPGSRTDRPPRRRQRA